MAVTSQLTSLEDFEGSPTFAGYGGGQAASVNDDVIAQGAQSAGRRVDNTTDKGFGATFTAADLSGANEHIKVWTFVTQWAEVTQVQVRISSGSDDDHELPVAEYPPLGGFIPVWVDVSRAPEVGGSANEASINEIGVLIDIGDVGGNAQNLILDEIMHGTSGYVWAGAGGDMDDFRTFESTNNEGVLITSNGIDFCYARLELSDSTNTSFDDSSFTLVFPDQALVSSTFMGVTVDLTNASTDIDLANATIQSGNVATATNRPDLLVTGTGGNFDLDTMTIAGLRTIELNNKCTLTNSVIQTCGVLDLTNNGSTVAGASLAGSSVLGSLVAADEGAIIWNADLDPDTALTGVTVSKGTAAHHAITFGTQVDSSTNSGEITLRNIEFTGFGSTDDANDSTVQFLSTTGSLTLNLIGCTVDGVAATASNFSVDDAAGMTVTVVIDPVTVEVTAVDADTDAPIEGASVYLITTPGAVVVLNGVTNSSGVLSGTYSGTLPANIDTTVSEVRDSSSEKPYDNFTLGGQITTAGYFQTALMRED